MSNDLLKQIDDLVASKTFNLDALDSIKKIKDELIERTAKMKDLEMKRDHFIGLTEKQKEEIDRLNNIVYEQKAKITEHEAMSFKARESIYEAEKHKAVAEAFRYSLETVFKPSTVRETVYQSIPLSQNYNGNTVVTPYQQEIKTTKEQL